MSDDQPDLPADLIDLQRKVFAAQDNLRAYDGDDPDERQRHRDAERAAVLELHRHPGHAEARKVGGGEALREAARGDG